MGLILDFEDGQTPLEEEEKEGLLIKSISTKGELNEFEQLLAYLFSRGVPAVFPKKVTLGKLISIL